MTILLDTHTFLWFIAGSDELSSLARELIEDPEIDVVSRRGLQEPNRTPFVNFTKLLLLSPEISERRLNGLTVGKR